MSIKLQSVGLGDGLDLATTHNNIKPGMVIDAVNFEAPVTGGYRRINGYERTAGGLTLDTFNWWAIGVSAVSGFTVGATITDAVSGATGLLVSIDTETLSLCLVNVVGTFAKGNGITGSAAIVTRTPTVQSAKTRKVKAVFKLAAENHYRALIQPVPGTGPVLGVWFYNGNIYAFRRSGSAVLLYRGTGTTWTLVPFMKVLRFTNGTMVDGEIVEGDTLTGASGATAVVKRFIKNAGSYGSNASGYMVVTTTGTWGAAESIRKGGINKATTSGTATDITFAVGANKFQFINYNFRASTDTFRVYGCDGVNPAFEFDGTVLTPILLPTGLSDAPLTNQPKYIEAHNNYLWLAFSKGSLQKSVIGQPLVWSGFLGAAEYGMGYEITGLASVLDTTLIIATTNSIMGMYGATELDFQRKLIANNVGCINYTMALSVRPLVLSKKGLMRVDATQSFGSFESNSQSRLIEPLITDYIINKNVVGTTVSRVKNQYRIYFDDGTGLIGTQDAMYVDQKLPSFTKFRYAHVPTCLASASVNDSEDILLFGDANGYVYRENTGVNCDGQPMVYILRTPFWHLKSPSVRKAFKRVEFDASSEGYSEIRLSKELSYNQNHTARDSVIDLETNGTGGYWDNAEWNNFAWSAATIDQQILSITGTGHNISLLFYGNSAISDPFVINTATFHYLDRKLNRG